MIRPGRPEDASALAQAQVRSWRQGYAGLLPEAFLASLEPAVRVPRWEAQLRDPTLTVLLDWDGDVLAGFASCGACRDADARAAETRAAETRAGWGELEALYYLQPYWGTGRAPLLLHAALDALHRAHGTVVTLWVLRENARAIAFYRRHGFVFDGADKVDVRERVILHERRMRLDLDRRFVPSL